MEEYKLEKKLSGRALSELFRKYNVFDYIIESYDALHTTGTKYMINDIDMYIDSRKVTN